MRLAAMLLSLALPVQAETLSQEIAHSGLAATQSRLLALTSPGDAERFATGGVTFLRAIEVTFQERYAMGLTDRTGMLPLLRLPLNDNPHPATFDPAAIVTRPFVFAAFLFAVGTQGEEIRFHGVEAPVDTIGTVGQFQRGADEFGEMVCVVIAVVSRLLSP